MVVAALLCCVFKELVGGDGVLMDGDGCCGAAMVVCVVMVSLGG